MKTRLKPIISSRTHPRAITKATAACQSPCFPNTRENRVLWNRTKRPRTASQEPDCIKATNVQNQPSRTKQNEEARMRRHINFQVPTTIQQLHSICILAYKRRRRSPSRKSRKARKQGQPIPNHPKMNPLHTQPQTRHQTAATQALHARSQCFPCFANRAHQPKTKIRLMNKPPDNPGNQENALPFRRSRFRDATPKKLKYQTVKKKDIKVETSHSRPPSTHGTTKPKGKKNEDERNRKHEPTPPLSP